MIHFLNKRHVISALGYVLLPVILCFSSFSYGSSDQSMTETDDRSDAFNIPINDIQRFSTVIAQIKRYYIEETSDKTLFNNAIRGMLTNLDPHSAFLDTDDLQDIETVTTGEFGGIGVEIIPENGYIKVISPLDDTPAFKAGIKAGDMIIRINSKLIKKMTTREAINMIRGKRGTNVVLTILRKGEKKPLRVTVTRDVIKVASVKSKMLDDGYGYVRVVFFQAPAKKDLYDAIAKLKKESNGKLKGLILDLRNNPGGLLDAAIHIADAFLDANKLNNDQLIVYTKGRIPGSDIRAKASPGDLLDGTPIVVLINGGSASASEIVAGALQDYDRAIIMGTKSFGKGSVQTIIPIDNTSGIKLTTALYYTPAGRSIQAMGIVPDIIVSALEVKKPEDENVLGNIDEADLEGHLENVSKNKKDESTKTSENGLEDEEEPETNPLAFSDYQLYEALIMLKGLNAVK